MNLTFSLLYYQLKKSLTLSCCSRNPKEILVGGARYYKEGMACGSHVLLIQAADLLTLWPDSPLLKNSIFICFGELPSTECITGIDLLLVDNHVLHEDVLNCLQDIFSLFDGWENAMSEVIHENHGYSDLINSCEAVSEMPISLLDCDFSYIAYDRLSIEMGLVDKYVTTNRVLPMEFVGMLLSDPEYPKAAQSHTLFTFTLDSVTSNYINIFHDEEPVGRLACLAGEDPAANDYHRSILLFLSTFVEKLYTQYHSFYLNNTALNIFHDLLQKELSGQRASRSQWDTVLKKVNWTNTDICQLIQLRPSHRYDKSMYGKYLCPEIEKRWIGSCCIEYQQNIFLLINKTQFSKNDKGDFDQQLAYFLRDNLLAAGVSRTFSGIEQLNAALRQTNIAFEAGPLKHPMFWYFRFNDYAFEYLLQHGLDGFMPAQICSEALLLLQKHDRETQTEYYKTLYIYFQSRYNAALAAKQLFIHRSTFLNRMDRILELTHLNLESFEIRTYLAISFSVIEKYSD